MMKMNKKSLKLSALTISILYALPSISAEISTNAALMQAMDKVTGRVNKIIVPVKSKISYGDFSLVLRSCKKRPAEETPENFAFIDVADKSFGKEEYNIFRGWIISSTPGINAIEHPIYDIWLLECIDKEVDNVTYLTDEELQKRDSLPTKEKISNNNDIVENKEVIPASEDKVIRIKEFIQEDRDIEKNIKEVPAYISDTSSKYISDIDEGQEPENLLLFTRIQEIEEKESKETDGDKELSDAIDNEIKELQNRN